MSSEDAPSSRSAGATRLLALLALAFVAALWLWHLDTPWSRVRGFADWIGAQNARIATNMDRLGLGATGGAQLLNLEEPEGPREWILYHGHPATLDVATSLVFRALGSRAPWGQRLLPLAAALLALALLALLARRLAIDPWLTLALFAAYPLVSAHGINFSYEPLCLAAMLALTLLFVKGWRWGLAPLFVLGGLLDFPVLYLAPYFALLVLLAREDVVGGARGGLARWGYCALLAAACVASLALHFAHVVLSGADAGNRGQGILEKILNSFAPKEGFEPSLGKFAAAAWDFFASGFGPAGLLLGLLALVACAARGASERRRAVFAFAFAGALHCVAFRAHFVVHDFWPVYFTPAFALASASWLGRAPAPARLAIAALTLVWGAWIGHGVWAERGAAPVREVARDLRALFDGTEREGGPTLYQLRMPAGWAIEQERGSPVYEGIDLAEKLLAVQQAGADVAALRAPLAAYRGFVDNVAARGDLGRAQYLVLDEGASEPGDRAAIRALLREGDGELRRVAERSYRVWVFEALYAPWRFPAMGGVPREALEELALRARVAAAARSFGGGARVLLLCGGGAPEEPFCGLRVGSADASILARRAREPRAFSGCSIVATPDGAFAEALRRAAGGELVERAPRPEERPLRALLIWPPPRS